MITVSKSELKAKMLEYFRRVEQTGEEIIVTNNRVPILKVSPLKKIKALRMYSADFRVKLNIMKTFSLTHPASGVKYNIWFFWILTLCSGGR